jgi:recombination protein RecA
MAKRERVVEKKSSYFADEKTNYNFVKTGCTLLDCALGGGYPLGRIVNIVGDKSTAKTALATEAIINFVRQYPNGAAAYRDAEAAFDEGYAAAMGLNTENVDFGPEEPLSTVEAFSRDLDKFIGGQSKERPGIYVLDSLDALTDETEESQDIGKGTYGVAKAKLLSILFRKTARKLETSKVLLVIISQVRDNIGVSFGDKHKRSGGRALDFYASQIIFLSHLKTLKKTVNKVERPYGIVVRAKIKKNKVALPLREAEFEFHFGLGVEDLLASVDWLSEVGRLDAIDLKPSDLKSYIKEIDGLSNKEYRQENDRVGLALKQVWRDVEISFLPKRSKYHD